MKQLVSITKRAESLLPARVQHLDKLVLQIAQVCNLSCKYCITQEGEWGKEQKLFYMTPQTVRSCIEKFAEVFEEIAVINFFGGEPTLNLPAMEAAGATVESLLQEGVLRKRPHLSMATNGMCASNDFIDIVNRYQIKFAVSLDGPEEINDLNRVTRSGQGSYKKIKENVAKLRAATGFPKGIAITYTANHQQSDLTLWQIICRLREDFGIWDFAVMPATNSPATPGQWDPLLSEPNRFIAEYADCIRHSLLEMTERDDAISIEYGKKALSLIVGDPGYEECPAGFSYFTVSAEGDVYPCQNLPEAAGFRITNIYDSSFFEELQTSRIRREIVRANREAIAAINKDESFSMCRICPSDNIGETGSLTVYSPQRFRLYKAIDQSAKGTFIEIMSGRDETAQNRFLKNLER